jgi:hypothetical protein
LVFVSLLTLISTSAAPDRVFIGRDVVLSKVHLQLCCKETVNRAVQLADLLVHEDLRGIAVTQTDVGQHLWYARCSLCLLDLFQIGIYISSQLVAGSVGTCAFAGKKLDATVSCRNYVCSVG